LLVARVPLTDLEFLDHLAAGGAGTSIGGTGAIDDTGAHVYMRAYDDDPHKSASPPRQRGVRAHLKDACRRTTSAALIL
jgi:hypothetical protein